MGIPIEFAIGFACGTLSFWLGYYMGARIWRKKEAKELHDGWSVMTDEEIKQSCKGRTYRLKEDEQDAKNKV